MSKNQIIQELYQSPDIAEAIGKMQPVELQDDLRQEMFMVLLEMDETRLRHLYDNGILKFFLIRTMLNMIKSDRSTFYKNFRNFIELKTYSDVHVWMEENEELLDGKLIKDKPLIEQVEITLPHLDFSQVFGNGRDGLYLKDMFLYYVFTFNQNAAALSKATKIPYKTVCRTITAAKCKIKSYLASLQQ